MDAARLGPEQSKKLTDFGFAGSAQSKISNPAGFMPGSRV